MNALAQPRTRTVMPEEMQRHIARFATVRPQSAYYNKDAGIPDAAYETVTAKTLYTLMAPSTRAGPMSAQPAILTQDNLSVIVAECPPGDKPMLHAHFCTVEHFFCLSGRFRIRWGDEGEHELQLEPWDMVAVPRGVRRDFTNVGDSTAYLLVLITGGQEADYFDISVAPGDSRAFRQEFGDEVAERFARIGIEFARTEAAG
ncbi:MAG TPA: cupin domain-containing protein [Ramlibacter sp.]|nr:cupin domain-containing protein [Ramlibacter sp.]